MKKNVKIALICALLLGSGVAAFWVWDGNPLARTQPRSRDVEELFEKMGVVRVPSDTPDVDVRLPDVNGRSVALSDFRGKIVFLNFWATWCPTCVMEMPAMEKLHQKLRKKDFAVVTISLQDSAEQVKNFFEKNKLTFTALLDSTGEIGARFGLRVIPTTIIIDKTGRAFGIVLGPREWDSSESVTLFEHLADDQAVIPTAAASDSG
jgi:peroxiredoxin